MTKLKEIKSAIGALLEKEYSQFRRRFLENDWKKWDQQTEADSKEGRLDFIVGQAERAREKDELTEL